MLHEAMTNIDYSDEDVKDPDSILVFPFKFEESANNALSLSVASITVSAKD